MAKASKGSAFERDICKRLSLWWTQNDPDGPRDAVFWRTSNSGGRATVRGRKGAATKNQHGDLCAIDPIGQPLMVLFTFELKRGYNRATLHDLIDAQPARTRAQTWRGWIAKAAASAKAAGTPYWAIIHKRDQREPVIAMPLPFYWQDNIRFDPSTIVSAGIDVAAMPLQLFLDNVRPADVPRWLKLIEHKKCR